MAGGWGCRDVGHKRQKLAVWVGAIQEQEIPYNLR